MSYYMSCLISLFNCSPKLKYTIFLSPIHMSCHLTSKMSFHLPSSISPGSIRPATLFSGLLFSSRTCFPPHYSHQTQHCLHVPLIPPPIIEQWRTVIIDVQHGQRGPFAAFKLTTTINKVQLRLDSEKRQHVNRPQDERIKSKLKWW